MKTNKKLVFALIIISIFISAGIGTFFIITSIEPNQETFESKIRGLMTKYKVPSLATGIVINDSLIWANGFGEQPDLNTVYMIGSITKTFTATALLQLNESNLINLDDDINDYLPFDVRHPNYLSTPITIQMLLTHTAGLARDLYYRMYYLDDQLIEWMNENIGANIPPFERPPLEEFLNGSLNSEGPYYNHSNWDSEPGTKFLYSNTGFLILGYIIEEITNQTLEDYFEENIFIPLNMTSTKYNYTEFDERNAIPYEWIDDTKYQLPLYNLFYSGAGALRSTVPDLAKYLIVHMNQGEYNGVQLLNPESVELMHEKHIPIPGSTVYYGLGWVIYEDGVQGHDGATFGYLANMYFKESGQGSYGMMVMFNRGSSFVLDIEFLTGFYTKVTQLLLERAEYLFIQPS